MTPEQEAYLITIAQGLISLNYTAEQVVAVLASAGPQLKLREIEFQIEKLQEQRAATNEGFDEQLNDLRAAANALAAQIRQGLSVE